MCVDDTCLWEDSVEKNLFSTYQYLTLGSSNGIVFNVKKFQRTGACRLLAWRGRDKANNWDAGEHHKLPQAYRYKWDHELLRTGGAGVLGFFKDGRHELLQRPAEQQGHLPLDSAAAGSLEKGKRDDC